MAQVRYLIWGLPVGPARLSHVSRGLAVGWAEEVWVTVLCPVAGRTPCHSGLVAAAEVALGRCWGLTGPARKQHLPAGTPLPFPPSTPLPEAAHLVSREKVPPLPRADLWSGVC